jgi:hypothetical protein
MYRPLYELLAFEIERRRKLCHLKRVAELSMQDVISLIYAT